MKRNVTCIICPRGCGLVADVEGEKVAVTGNGCPRGQDYAINECLHPVRTVTIALRVANRDNTMVSVKTAQAIPKEKMMDAVTMLRSLKIKAPIKAGDTVCESVFGSPVISTCTVL